MSLRLSVPVLERLTEIVDSEIEEDELLPGLESLVRHLAAVLTHESVPEFLPQLYETEVISEAEGTQTIECRLVERSVETFNLSK